VSDLERKLTHSRGLPTLPEVAQRILAIREDDGADLSQLPSILADDPDLSADVLQLINSPMYGLTRQIGSLREAVLYLGEKAVGSLALAFCCVRALRSSGVPDALAPMWHCSLMNGLAARRLANEVGGWEAEEALLAGLLADAGVPLLYNMVADYPYLLACFYEGESDLLELERSGLETDHMRIGSLLLERWGLPPYLRVIVGAHHEPSNLPPGSQGELCARILTAAWLCTRALSVPGFVAATTVLDQHVATLLGISTTVVHAIASELPDELRETAELFDIPADSQKSYAELVERADAGLHELVHSVQSSAGRSDEGDKAEVSDFAEIREQLSEHVTVDEQTELLTRSSFEMLLGAFHRLARQKHMSLGLLILEVEELKTLEERLGASAVELLIAELRTRIATQLRKTDMIARFADAQIAVLAPGCPPHALENAAQRLLSTVEAAPVDIGDEVVDCRISIGLAATTPDRDGRDPRALVSLASSALDQARAAPESIQAG
jgi:diguanylate cyclase (GGDEF)-like protein